MVLINGAKAKLYIYVKNMASLKKRHLQEMQLAPLFTT
jgi:hypothetical protein